MVPVTLGSNNLSQLTKLAQYVLQSVVCSWPFYLPPSDRPGTGDYKMPDDSSNTFEIGVFVFIFVFIHFKSIRIRIRILYKVFAPGLPMSVRQCVRSSRFIKGFITPLFMNINSPNLHKRFMSTKACLL